MTKHPLPRGDIAFPVQRARGATRMQNPVTDQAKLFRH